MPTIIALLFVAAVVAAVISYRNFLHTRREEEAKLEWLRHRELIVLAIQVPKNNDKSPLAAEQVFASLHGTFQGHTSIQEELSFEIVATPGVVRFYAVIPSHLRDFIEGQIYAQYPNVEIQQVDDYAGTLDRSNLHVAGTDIVLDKPDVYPIKQYQSFDVDPLAGITSVLANLKEHEQTWIQMIIRPEDEKWQQRGINLVAAIKAGKPGVSTKSHFFIRFINFGGHLVGSLLRFLSGPAASPTASADQKVKELSSPVQEALHGIEEKITKLGFATKVRLVAIAPDTVRAQANLTAIMSAYTQFNTNNLNNLLASQPKIDDEEFFGLYWSRLFLDTGHVFNITELASLFHFPSISAETPNIVWAGARKSEPPANLPLNQKIDPKELTNLGITDFRQRTEKFGIKIRDRLRHMYVIGKSGTGKSTLMENMILDDIREDRGVIVVDPHGELIDHVIDEIPDHRMKDTILFDPADRDFPIGFNLLEAVDPEMKGIVTSGFVGILEKIFGNSWGPRMEHILRNTVLALLDTPGTTMLGIPKILVEKKYRMEIMKNIQDPVVRDFWESEFEQWDPKFRTEAVAPIQNKVGQFLSTPTIRNIVGQSKSTIDIRNVMDAEKILLVNLSKGKIGEDNSALLGAMMITKVQLAAMSRANLKEEDRKPTFLYVDEFQNFATQSFATILSEARKYALSLTMANQYIAQMEEVVREAVFGNVGSLISFRVGANDAPFLAKEFEPVFDENDLVNLDIHHIYLKMSIDGKSAKAFSAMTLPPIRQYTGHAPEIRRLTQQNYGVPREQVEAEITKWNEETKPKLVIHPGQERFIRNGSAPATTPTQPITSSQSTAPSVPPVTAPQPSIPDRPFSPAPQTTSPSTELATVQPTEVLPVVAPTVSHALVTEPTAPEAPAVLAETTPAQPAPAAAMLAEAGETVPSEPRPRPLPKNLINGIHYREVAKRGGEKWYFGIPYHLADGTPAGNFDIPDRQVQPPAHFERSDHRPTEQASRQANSDRPAQSRPNDRRPERERPVRQKKTVPNDALRRAIEEIETKRRQDDRAGDSQANTAVTPPEPASVSSAPLAPSSPSTLQEAKQDQPIEL